MHTYVYIHIHEYVFDDVGGPDGRFLSVKTAGGGMNFNDLRQYNLDVDFIGKRVFLLFIYTYMS